MADGRPTVLGTVTVFSILGIVFVVLKLCHVINWPWWWVTAPFWGPCAVFFVVFLVLLVSYFVRLGKVPRGPWGR